MGELHFAADVVLIIALLLQASSAKKDKKPKPNVINIAGEEVEENAEFQKLRSLYSVGDNFLAGDKIDLEGAVRESGGAHAIIAKSEDSRFLVKIMSDIDWDSLHEHLTDYIKYLGDNPESLLPRFFSAFKRKKDGKKWVAMFNWLSGKGFADKRKTRVFDLKGTTCSHEPGDRLVRMEMGDVKVPTLKDLNFAQNPMVMHTSAEVRTRLLEQLTADTEFLKAKELMDYSLILRVMSIGQCDQVALDNVCPTKVDGLYQTFFQEQNGYHATVDENSRTMTVYEFGMIDVLQPYNTKKAWADSYKSWKCGDGEIRDTVDATEYQQRFVDFFASRIVGDARVVDLAECDAAKGFTGSQCTVIDLQPGPSGARFSDGFRSMGLWLVVIVMAAWGATAWICRGQLAKLRKRLSEVSQAPQVLSPTPQSNQFPFPDSQCSYPNYNQPMSGAPSWGACPSPMDPVPSWGHVNANWSHPSMMALQQRV